MVTGRLPRHRETKSPVPSRRSNVREHGGFGLRSHGAVADGQVMSLSRLLDDALGPLSLADVEPTSLPTEPIVMTGPSDDAVAPAAGESTGSLPPWWLLATAKPLPQRSATQPTDEVVLPATTELVPDGDTDSPEASVLSAMAGLAAWTQSTPPEAQQPSRAAGTGYTTLPPEAPVVDLPTVPPVSQPIADQAPETDVRAWKPGDDDILPTRRKRTWRPFRR